MRTVRYHEHGGPEVLELEEVPRPEPGEDELLVEVRAAAVNPVDAHFREGSYPTDLPRIPGSDAAGIVVETGPGVEAFEEGDRVFATGLGNDRDGACAEFVAVPTDSRPTSPRGSISRSARPSRWSA
jgi:NADPH2:quinone reductase